VAIMAEAERRRNGNGKSSTLATAYFGAGRRPPQRMIVESAHDPHAGCCHLDEVDMRATGSSHAARVVVLIARLQTPAAHETIRELAGCLKAMSGDQGMTTDRRGSPCAVAHGSAMLPLVEVADYNLQLRDEAGFIGDRASKGVFRALIDDWRKPLRRLGHDPFGDEPSTALDKQRLDDLLCEGDPEAAGVVQGAIEGFAHELAEVLRRFLNIDRWRNTERLVLGGGFSGNRIGQLAIGRASLLLKAQGIATEVAIICHDPDEAGLIGAVHLVPAAMFRDGDAVLAVDIGGTNIRAGIVALERELAPHFSKARVWKFKLWRHGEQGVGREDTVARLIAMLRQLSSEADAAGLRLAPYIGVGCPGRIAPDGSISNGAQNLPGNWEGSDFNLPATLHDAIPKIGAADTVIVMHNDAVVQGLSELPRMRDVATWAAFTVGTGLGNALFTNRGG
jgi:hypothetical protein